MTKQAKVLMDDIKTKLEENDFALWMQSVSITNCNRELFYSRADNGEIFEAAQEVCQWWLKIKKKNPCSKNILNEKEWSTLKAAIKAYEPRLKGRSIDEAAVILSSLSVAKCNALLLRGLPKEYHVWG
jgi:hypothetical protein